MKFKMRMDITRERKVLFLSIPVAAFLLILGLVSGDLGVLGNTIILSVFLLLIPQLVFRYMAFRDLKEMEYKYPVFLRDLVESTKAGLPLHKAIIFSSKNNYGVLSREVKKMANQLSWNVNIIKVLEQSKKRLKNSETLSRTIRIMIETYKSGGETPETLNSLSSTLLTIQETQKERKSMLNQYVVAMYAISFVFIGIIVGINRLMVPIFESMAAPGGIGSPVNIIQNPCTYCSYRFSPECTPCSIYSGICTVFGVNTERISCYYLALFFSMSLMQAITGGLVAGQIGDNSVKAGIKHSLILFTVAFGAFFILVKLNLIGG